MKHRLSEQRGRVAERRSSETASQRECRLSVSAKHEVLRILVDVGADVQLTKPDGVTALQIACGEGSEECAEILIAAGANLYSKDNTGVSCADEVRNKDMLSRLKTRAQEVQPGEAGAAAPGKEALQRVPTPPGSGAFPRHHSVIIL